MTRPAAVTFILVVLCSATLGALKTGKTHKNASDSISIELDTPSNTISEQFLSVTIDSHAIQSNWYGMDFRSQKLINLGKALAPAMLRIGGTDQDYLLFDMDSRKEDEQKLTTRQRTESEHNFTMSTSQWDAINQFATATGWEITFGLNVLLRRDDDWDTANAAQLLSYTHSKGYKVNWELGNEPNRFPKLNVSDISPEQLAKDFGTLRKLLDKMSITANYVAGPDITQGGDGFLERFLKVLPQGAIDAVTWHHYYENGATAKLQDFYNPDILDQFVDSSLNQLAEIKKFNQSRDLELWLGETSSCFGGGSPTLSNSYVAGFMWLDKLGLAAIIDHTRVFRQTFDGGNYGLLNEDTLLPLPDYWLSVLYKKLVGPKVLYVHDSTKPGRRIRAYAHCAKAPLYPAGSVVLLLLNTNNVNEVLEVKNHELISSKRDIYWLTPQGVQGLLSKKVMLNGELLGLVNNENIPDLKPVEQPAKEYVHLPPLSFGFYVFKDAKAQGCM